MKSSFSKIIGFILVMIFSVNMVSFALAENEYSLDDALGLVGKGLGRIEISDDFANLNWKTDEEYTYNDGKIIILWREAPLKEFEISETPFADDYEGKDIGEVRTYLCTDLMERIPEELRAKTSGEVGNVIMIETQPMLSGEITSYEESLLGDYALTEEDIESLLKGEQPSLMAMLALMQEPKPSAYKPVFATVVVVSLYNADTGDSIFLEWDFFDHEELRNNPQAADIWEDMQYYGDFMDEFTMADGKISVTAEEIDTHLNNIASISEKDYETFSAIREESIFPDLLISIQERYWEMARDLAECEPDPQIRANYENAIEANNQDIFAMVVGMQSYSGISKSDMEIRNDLSYIGRPSQAQMEEMLQEVVEFFDSTLGWELLYLLLL